MASLFLCSERSDHLKMHVRKLKAVNFVTRTLRYSKVPCGYQSWLSASRPMPPVSAPRHRANQSGPPNFGTGLVPASDFIFILVPGLAGCRTVRHFKKIGSEVWLAKSREYQVTL
jgi:hypothetical protein